MQYLVQKTLLFGSIKILNSLKVIDTVSFGSECGKIELLKSIADVLCNEPSEYTLMLKHELDKGLSFPKARENALLLYLNDIRKYANILSGSNNILAIEYLKAINNTKSSLYPLTITRKNVDYHDKKINNGFASSTAIRQMVMKRDINSIKDAVPNSVYEILIDRIQNGNVVPSLSCFEKQILYKLRSMDIYDIEALHEVSEGLENAIKNAANSCNNIVDLIKKIKSKRYTQTRIQRILLYALFDITKEMYNELISCPPYVRVLGMNEKGKELLSKISANNPKLKIVTSVKSFLDSCSPKKSTDRALIGMMELDILASNIYTLGFEYDSQANLDYTKKMIVI